jgi:hypothetical protein
MLARDPLMPSVVSARRLRVSVSVNYRNDDAEQFKLVAVGDQVEATYTEAVAISIE